MSVAGNTRNLRHGHLSLADGQLGTGSAANTMVIPIDEGNLNFTEATPAALVKNRGALDHFSKGEEMPVSVSFTIKFTAYKSMTSQAIVPDSGDAGSGPDGGAVTGFTVRDFLLNGGGLLTSTNGRTDNFTCTLMFTIDNPMSTGDEAEVLTFTLFKTEDIKFSEGAECNTLAVSGRANITVPASSRS